MSKPDTWMPLYIGDYLADTAHLSCEQHGAYFLLMMHAWRNGGSIPADPEILQRITRLNGALWMRTGPPVLALWERDGDVYRQKRLTSELAGAAESRAKAIAKAEIAAAARWGREHAPSNAPSIPPSNASGSAPSNASSTPQAMLKECPSPSPSEVKNKDTRRKPAATSLPADFAVSARVRAWAEGKGYGDLGVYLETFAGRMMASGKRYTDWDQAFMNAVREDWYGLRDSAAPPVAAAKRVAL